MACFLVPAGTAIVTTALRKKIPEKLHIDWLNKMLWGGTIMLMVEHIAHKEVVLYPPFLTAGLPEIMPELIKIGLPMTISVCLVWAIMVIVATAHNKKTSNIHI